jgi:hypothetical protein
MRKSNSSIRGPLIFAAALVAAHSVFVVCIAYGVSHSSGNELGMWWVIPASVNMPTSLLINIDRVGSRFYLPLFLTIGLVQWSVVGFVVGWITQFFWRRRRDVLGISG